ncbi:hypothetical protein HMPREF9629_01132 [Peptoanaerobacter stomatis]|uniref:4'-phosphopantetheinyl transferase domain-containing protein n=2 Tax=Peptoanaerobacter stomatis TaxID=796937 RepID=G9WY81_9FIRM|nr:4'-phosphopantetheinyl transferase superfamily protein [Peptoanaerobacter stomatis]EHL16585.1 hypothetical protein HMPREF9629_01132 [Peptoanaerobacter stomatis]
MKTYIFLSSLNKKIKTDDYVKYILSKYYFMDFGDIEIIRGQNGKPYIKNSDIKYSVSHKKDYIVAVFSHDEIGIDIEILTDKDYSGIVNRYFFEDERKYILTPTSELEKNKRFFEIWTKKEAYIKKYDLNISYIKKIDSLKEDIETFKINDLIISVCS